MAVLETSELKMRMALPALSSIAANPLKVIGTFLVLAIVSAIVVPDELGWLSLLRMVTLATSITVIGVTAGAAGLANRPPRRPKAPKPRVAKLDRVGFEPRRQLQVPQRRCQICGRPLTNPGSQMAGVGPDCRAKYGTRPLLVRNPAHIDWERRRHQALARQQRDQVRLDQEHQVALLEHGQRERAWEAQLQTPLNRTRASIVRLSTQTLTIDAGLIVSFVLAEIVALGVDTAGLSFW